MAKAKSKKGAKDDIDVEEGLDEGDPEVEDEPTQPIVAATPPTDPKVLQALRDAVVKAYYSGTHEQLVTATRALYEANDPDPPKEAYLITNWKK